MMQNSSYKGFNTDLKKDPYSSSAVAAAAASSISSSFGSATMDLTSALNPLTNPYASQMQHVMKAEKAAAVGVSAYPNPYAGHPGATTAHGNHQRSSITDLFGKMMNYPPAMSAMTSAAAAAASVLTPPYYPHHQGGGPGSHHQNGMYGTVDKIEGHL